MLQDDNMRRLEALTGSERMAVMCIGNILLLDEGVGPAVARELMENYDFPPNVTVLDSGTMGMSLIGDFAQYDYILTVDAVDGTGEPPGTVFHFLPQDMAENRIFHGAHDTRFIDVLEASALLGHEPAGECIGVQIENMSPSQLVIGLTPQVAAAVPLLCETVLATLYGHGVRGIIDRSTGMEVCGPREPRD
ncbi:MAG: hydrogenase maturation protease [Coriobacteriales bacterium]|nr:hydrogenase maturation protease [Coriobacteriales bacterium]